MKKILYPLFIVFPALFAGCGGEVDSEIEPPISVAHQPEDLSRCLSPVGVEISSIESVVDWINAMPKPLTLACFIASLPRPLAYNATWSTLSLQPAVGRRNPRIFIQYDKLWLSFVPQEKVSIFSDSKGEKSYIWDDDDIQLLEFSFEVESDQTYQQSIKGELTFPILKELPRNAAYTRVAVGPANTRSTCGECHGGETAIGTLDGAPIFRSKMFRTTRTYEVGHAELLNEYLSCNPEINTGVGTDNNEWYRCQMYDAFFGQGSTEWIRFRTEIGTYLPE